MGIGKINSGLGGIGLEGDRRATEGASTPRERKHIDIRQLLQVHYEGVAPDVAKEEVIHNGGGGKY